jgi:hypothetical protein
MLTIISYNLSSFAQFTNPISADIALSTTLLAAGRSSSTCNVRLPTQKNRPDAFTTTSAPPRIPLPLAPHPHHDDAAPSSSLHPPPLVRPVLSAYAELVWIGGPT